MWLKIKFKSDLFELQQAAAVSLSLVERGARNLSVPSIWPGDEDDSPNFLIIILGNGGIVSITPTDILLLLVPSDGHETDTLPPNKKCVIYSRLRTKSNRNSCRWWLDGVPVLFTFNNR